jgi:hypothetical protein
VAVLIEGISVVIRCRSIVERASGGVAAFMKTLPNKTLRSDGELACVHFMTPHDTQSYVEILGKAGLVYRGVDGEPIDLVVVDQNRGPVIPCDWLDFGHTDWNNDPLQPIAVCCARPVKNTGVVAPEGWSYAESLTANSRFVAGDEIPPNLEFLRHDGGVDVLRDKETGQNFFISRS